MYSLFKQCNSVGRYMFLSNSIQARAGAMPVDRVAILLLLLVQAILCGLYSTTLVHCLRWLMFADEGWKRRKRISWPMSIITILLSIFSSIALRLTVEWEFRYVRGDIEFYLTATEDLARVRMLH